MSKNALDVWGLDKESALHKFFVGEPMGTIAASPDGHFFAAGSLTGAAYVWEVSTGRLVRTWPAHFKAVSAVCFAAEGSVLVTAGEDTVVSAWSLASLLDPAGGGGAGGGAAPSPMYSWAEHSLPVTALACSGGGAGGAALVASASADRTCKLWTLGGGHLLRTITLPAALGAVAMDACESTLYAGAVDGRIFEVPLNASPPMAAGGGGGGGGGGGVGSMAGGSGSGPPSGPSGTVSAAAVLDGHTRAVTALTCTADGERVVSSSEDGTARVWDAASRQTTHILRHPKAAPISAIAMAPRARVAGDGSGGGGGGGGEKRKLAPLAPFSRFASGGGGGGGGSGGGRGGKLQSWEGAPLVLRGCGAEASGAPERLLPLGGGGGWGGGGGSSSLGKRARCEDGGEATAGRDRGGGGGGGGGSAEGDDAVALRKQLAAAEARAVAAEEEVTSWKQKHGELRAFVAEELVTREANK